MAASITKRGLVVSKLTLTTSSVHYYSAWTDPLTCLIYYIVVFGGGFNPPAMSDGSIVAAGYWGPRQSRDSMHCQKGN